MRREPSSEHCLGSTLVSTVPKILLVVLAALPHHCFCASAATAPPSVVWSISANVANDTSVLPIFVDDSFVVMQQQDPHRGYVGVLSLFSTSTKVVEWTQPAPCPFASSEYSTTTSADALRVFHIRRTGRNRLTYMCWIAGEHRGHVVTIDTRTGNTTSALRVHAAGLRKTEAVYTIGSVASGAYCMNGQADGALCVDETGTTLWRLGVLPASSASVLPLWINEFNGTLAVQYSSGIAIQTFDLWTGVARPTVLIPSPSQYAMQVGERYLVYVSTYDSPAVVSTLDLATGNLSAAFQLVNSTYQTVESNPGAASTALMVTDGSVPHMMVTISQNSPNVLRGWKVPATSTVAARIEPRFETPLSGSLWCTSWGVSPGFVFVAKERQTTYWNSPTSQTQFFYEVTQVGNGAVVDSFSVPAAASMLETIQERDGYIIIAAGSKSQYYSGKGDTSVTVVNATTGAVLWTQAEVEVVGPSDAPIVLSAATSDRCLLVAPVPSYGSPPFGRVLCLSM